MATTNTAAEKVEKEIIRLEHLSATRVTLKLVDVLAFLKEINNELTPNEPDET